MITNHGDTLANLVQNCRRQSSKIRVTVARTTKFPDVVPMVHRLIQSYISPNQLAISLYRSPRNQTAQTIGVGSPEGTTHPTDKPAVLQPGAQGSINTFITDFSQKHYKNRAIRTASDTGYICHLTQSFKTFGITGHTVILLQNHVRYILMLKTWDFRNIKKWY